MLAAWAASPARFREDANAEDELAHGAYRDRVIVELAQNAADAASRAGVAGRLLLRLDRTTLLAANTGAPLDAAGVEGLSTLRASTKRDDSSAVGRFGVGFAAVLAVTDEPAILSRGGGVRWSRDAAVAEVATIAELADEAARRGRAVPVLRLPFPADGVRPLDGASYDTVVTLPLRDEAAAQLVRERLAALDDALLLALPALAEVTVDVDGEVTVWRAESLPPAEADQRVVEAGVRVDESTSGTRLGLRRVADRRWRIAERSGPVDLALLADRPHEERSRLRWSVVVAVPVSVGGDPVPLPPSVSAVVHAPTPADDRVDLPALVIATLPMDSSRRRVAPGPLTDHLVAQAGRAYADLVASFDSPGALDLVPGPFGVDRFDTAVHVAVRDALADTPFVLTAAGARVRPREVVLVDGLRNAADPAALGEVVAGLPAPGWWRPEQLRRLEVRVVALADVVEDLATLRREPAWWRDLYAALDGADLEALAALPVPLADGRLVRGPRGLLLPTDVAERDLEVFHLRVVAGEAVHPLLRRLGAAEASPTSILRHPMVRAAAEATTGGDDDPGPVAEAVLRLLPAAGLTCEDEPWLGGLQLPDRTGRPVPATELLLPGSPVLDLMDADPDEFTVAGDVVSRHGAGVLRAVGVRDGFGTIHDADVALDDEVWHDLDDEEGWIDAVLANVPDDGVPPVVAEFVAVRDLDLVRAGSWPAALRVLASDQQTHAAVVEPAHVIAGDGARRPVPSYTAWWLRQHVRVEGNPLDRLCPADAEPAVRTLLTPVALDVDPSFARAIGMVYRLADARADVLLDRLADPSSAVTAGLLAEIYADLAGRDPMSVRPPARLRIPAGLDSRVVDAAEVVLADAPFWLQLDLPAALPGPTGLADVLDIDLVAEVFDARPESRGRVLAVPGVVASVLPEAPATYVEHDDLMVAGRSVAWWVESGVVHAATTDGLARGLAWVAGRWSARWLVAAVLVDPASAATLATDEMFDRR